MMMREHKPRYRGINELFDSDASDVLKQKLLSPFFRMKIVFSIICIFFYPFSVIHHGLGTTCGILMGGAGEEKERFSGQKLKIPDNSRENQVRINSDWNSVR